ncbi:MAG: hypothetical protein ACFFD7_04235 [Candidatus Thorarchaeota archaeon]
MANKRLILVLSIIFLTGLSLTTINSYAHSPMHMEIEFDDVENHLYLSIIHGVTDPDYHYIKTITINVTDHLTENSTISIFTYTSQPSRNIFSYEYSGIIAQENDIIEVTATCSLEGDYVKKIIIGHGYPEPKGSFSSVVLPTLISTFIVMSIIFLPRFYKRNDQANIEMKKLSNNK